MKDTNKPTKNICESLMVYPLFEKRIVPNERIEGTQIPTNMPSSFWPLNQRFTESKKDRNAARQSMIFASLILVILIG